VTTTTKLLIAGLGLAGLGWYYSTLPDHARGKFHNLAEIGVVGGALAIPLGIWSLQKWPDAHWKTAVLMTGFGLAVKQVMLAEEGHAPALPAHEPAALPAHA
jgi:hypothetical protein